MIRPTIEGMLVAASASHEHLDLGVLDALTRHTENLDAVLAAREDIDGAVVISTCNRLEIYMDAERFHPAIDAAVGAIEQASGLGREQVAGALEMSMGADAVTHLYEVMAGLRSLVVGESEIAGQVRGAFTRALEAGHTTAMLNDLFHVGLQHAKRVSSTTGLGSVGRSGGIVALERAAQRLTVPFAQTTVLLLGTGAYARVITAELQRRGAREVLVYSPSGRAQDYARSHDVRAVAAEGLAAAVLSADLVVAASGQGERTLRAADVAARGGRQLVVLDLALHSDLEPGVRDLDGVDVITLRDIADDIDDTALLEQARMIAAEGARRFTSRQRMRTVDPAVTFLRGTVAGAVSEEVEKIRARYDDAVAEDFERHLRRIAAKVLHSPTVRARELARDGQAEQYVAAFHTLFGVDVQEVSRPPRPSQNPPHQPDSPRGDDAPQRSEQEEPV